MGSTLFFEDRTAKLHFVTHYLKSLNYTSTQLSTVTHELQQTVAREGLMTLDVVKGLHFSVGKNFPNDPHFGDNTLLLNK